MRFRLLGLLDVAAEGAAVSIGPGKESALLAILLLAANEPVSTDRLAEWLWGDGQPGNPTKTIQIYVSRLRKRLGPGRLATTAGGYLMITEPDELDIELFERLAGEGRRALEDGHFEQAAQLLSDALALWRGPPLADFTFETFAQAPIRRLEELREAAAADRVDARLALRQAAELLPELEALVHANPRRERLRAQLMLCLYRSGRQAEALDVYASARVTLVEELGVEPGPELRELHRAILRQDPALDPLPPGHAPEHGGRSAFVGRVSELAELRRGLDDAVGGRGRLFLLVGEPGIGKSRLADELIASSRDLGARVLVGRCWEAGGAPAYWPWVQSLRSYVRDLDAAALETQLGAGAPELAQILPELGEALPGLREPSCSDAEPARFRLFDAAAEFLRRAARERPILLFLDDLHAADAPSLLLLQFVARQLASMRVLVLGACRDVDPAPNEALGALLGEVAREPLSVRVSLGGLREHEVSEYLELTAAELASPELAALLHQETEGNPLFVGEMVRLVALEGVQAGTGGKLAIPQTVRDVIARRLTHLSTECNRVLELASILGRDFSLEGLARLSGRSKDDLLDVLDEAMAARLVVDAAGTGRRLRFAHIIIRDTLYEGLTSARRMRLHRQALDVLEALYGTEPGPNLAELAHHAVAGSDFERGLEYARRTADRALGLLAYEEASRLYETALATLELSESDHGNTRCELLLSLGQAQARAGDTRAATETFLAAAATARRLGSRRELARAVAGYAREDMYLRAGDDERLVPLLEEGLAALGEKDVELRAKLLGRLAGALRDEPTRDRRDQVSREALELARRTGNRAALAYALDGRIPAIIAPDTLDECLVLAAELCEVAEEIGDTEREMHGQLHHLVVLMMLADVTDLEARIDTISHLAAGLRQPAYLWEARAAEATLALTAGRFDEADELIAQAFALGGQAKPDIAVPVFRLQRCLLCDFRGDLEQIELEIRALATDWPARPAFRCALAHLYARLDRPDQAAEIFEPLVEDDCAALPFDQEWLFGMSLLAETSALLGHRDSAAVLHRLLTPWAELNAADWPEGLRGSVARYLGLLSATTHSWDAAEDHFERALVLNERMSGPPWIALTQCDYACMLLARGRDGDCERGQILLDSSLTTLRELGMNGRIPTAEALGRELRPTA